MIDKITGVMPIKQERALLFALAIVERGAHLPPIGRVRRGPPGLSADSWSANTISRIASVARVFTSFVAM